MSTESLVNTVSGIEDGNLETVDNLTVLEQFIQTNAKEILKEVDHKTLSEVFGSRVAEALTSNEPDNPYSTSAMRGFLQAVLNGVTEEEVDENPMPEDFSNAMESLRSIYHSPDDNVQYLWKSRIHERFIASEDWIQWPEGELKSSIRSIDTGKHVPTLEATASYYFLHKDNSKMIWIRSDFYGTISTEIYGDNAKDVDDLIKIFEEYVEQPDPYNGKIIRIESEGVRIIPENNEALSPYSEKIEAAVSWMSSISDSEVRNMLTQASLPLRAGLLLEGPPGSGKTTLARRIANDLSGETTVIYATPSVSIADVFSFSNRYSPALIILEDVESFFGERGNSDFSSFLNELDGIDQQGGKMILATTNDSSSFDEAIRRPGRLERRAVIADVQPGAHAKMVASRLPNESEETVKQLITAIEEKVGDKTVTPAVIDSLARHAIMLKLDGEALLDYAVNDWEPHYEGLSYIDSSPVSKRSPRIRRRSNKR